MELDRRRLVLGTGAAAAASVTGVPAHAATEADESTPLVDTAGRVDWDAVRRQFRLDPSWTDLAAFLLASHPRPVRKSIDHYRALLDENPTWILDNIRPELRRLRASLAGYLGGRPDEIVLTPNTTVGLGLVYSSLVLKPGQELFITEHDHAAHRRSVERAARKQGATVRRGKLYDDPARATADQAAERLRRAIGPRTRAVGVTWVHSSTGVKMPVPALAEVVEEANRGRAEEDRCVLIVDGLHGFGVEDTEAARLGADFFVSGTHKWLFGPRGTGCVLARREVWAPLAPVLSDGAPKEDPDTPTTADDMTPGTFWAYEHTFSVPAAVAFHEKLGRARVQRRIHDLSDQLRQGLKRIPGVTVHTPLDPAMSSGLTCFEIDGIDHKDVVTRLAHRRIRASSAAYRVPYPRLGTGITNFPEEIDRTLAAVRDIAGAGAGTA